MGIYHLSNKAVDDLKGIWNYTCLHWSEKQAEKYFKQLILSIEKLAQKKIKGKRYLYISPNLLGLKVNEHIVFYQDFKQDDILVIRILHKSMDLKNRLSE